MNIEDLTPGNIVEYLYPYTRTGKKMGTNDAKFGTGRFVSIDPKGRILLEDNQGDQWKISEHWIRWDRTEHYKLKLDGVD